MFGVDPQPEWGNGSVRITNQQILEGPCTYQESEDPKF